MRERGFTIIELVITLLIVVALGAIAMPQVNRYNQRFNDSRAMADLKKIIDAQESYFAEHARYTDNAMALEEFYGASEGVIFQLFHSFGSPDIYGALTYHVEGTKTFCFVSDTDSEIREEQGAPTSNICVH